MELTVRLTGAATAEAPATSGLLVAAACSLVLLAVGVAHYRGAWRWLAEFSLLRPTTTAALAWLGAGGLLATAALALSGATSTLGALATLLLGALGLVLGVVGLVGVVWLPRRLRPRWMSERSAA